MREHGSPPSPLRNLDEDGLRADWFSSKVAAKTVDLTNREEGSPCMSPCLNRARVDHRAERLGAWRTTPQSPPPVSKHELAVARRSVVRAGCLLFSVNLEKVSGLHGLDGI